MRVMLSAIALSAAFVAQGAPNFSGKWIIQAPAGRGGGRGGGQTLTITQVGSEIAGELLGGGGGGGGSAAPINNELYDGKVENGTVSFYVWRGTDKPYKVSYTGTLNAAGDEMALTVTGVPARGSAPAPQTVTARRAK